MAVWLSMSMSYVGPGGSANTSRVAVSVDVHWDSVSYNGNSPPVSVTIDGVTDTANVSFNTGKTGSGSQNIYSKYWDIAHDSNGSARTVYASASYATGTASGTVSASASLPLAAIGGGSSGGDSGGDEGGNEGGTGGGGSGSDDSSANIQTHPDTNCAYLGTSQGGEVYGNNALSGSEWFIKFRAPSDLAVSKSVTVRLTNFGVYSDGNSYNLPFMLWEGEPDGSDGYFTWVDGLPSEFKTMYSVYSVVIPTAELKPGTEYVVHITSSANNLVYADAPAAIIIDYVARGGVHIKTAGVETKYLAHMKNGDTWDLYEPYVKNGESWDKIGG